MAGLFEKRFIVVAGKGGVGRTTVSMIIGLCAATRGKRTLVCLAGAPLRYAELLGGVAIGDEIHRISENLEVINLDPVASREEYGLKVLKSPTLHRLVFGSKIVNTFLDAVPGLSEWAMLGKATFHALEGSSGRDGYDLVVFDSPATGHGLDLLSLPTAIVASIPAGRIREEAQIRVKLLGNPRLCEIVPVTIPEEIPVNEAGELVEALKERGLPVRRMVVNMVSRGVHGDGIAEALDGAADPSVDWLIPATVEAARLEIQERSIARLKRESGLPVIELPAIPDGVDDATLLHLARRFNETV